MGDICITVNNKNNNLVSKMIHNRCLKHIYDTVDLSWRLGDSFIPFNIYWMPTICLGLW